MSNDHQLKDAVSVITSVTVETSASEATRSAVYWVIPDKGKESTIRDATDK